MTKTRQMFEDLTNKIIEVIEKNEAGEWTKPWTSVFAASGIPHNATTQKDYHGFNTLMLWAVGMEFEYPTQEWATYKQWKKAGAQVRKGEKGVKLVKWGKTHKCEGCGYKGQRPSPCGCAVEYRDAYVWASSFTVFNAAQVDGYEPETVELPGGFDPMAHVEDFVEKTGAIINEKPGDRAFYSRGTDEITVPLREQFETAQGFYGTVLHELTHWTGAGHRLDREKGFRFGDDKYAREELVAELGATFLSAKLGVEVEPHMEHHAYLASWLRSLRSDHMALYRAAKDAEAAAEFLLDEAEMGALLAEDLEGDLVGASA